MQLCSTLIRNVQVLDGSGAPALTADVAIHEGRIHSIGHREQLSAAQTFDGSGLALAPGFIDVHTHDDLSVVRSPQMLPKLSQGVTTVIVGNCGISAAPVQLRGPAPDPMNLLGDDAAFLYPTFASYAQAVRDAQPAVNVAALVGHTALRNNHMERLDRVATHAQIESMRAQLKEALDQGAFGLSTGLAYLSAYSASTEEVLALAELLAHAGALYTTHMRSESNDVLRAMDEAFHIGAHARVPVVISHFKCAGIDNWGRVPQLLERFDQARQRQPVACDCYPYAAGSSTLDLRQVDERVTIRITWSTPHPEMAGQTLAAIAQTWRLPQREAARRLQPAGAIYHSIAEEDMQAILRHPATMIGSDGLPNDPLPHPRLWGTFPRVLGYYCRERQLFSLPEAVRKMTSLPARQFGLAERGQIREGYCADLVLFDPASVCDTATYQAPAQAAAGIRAVWVNGTLSYWNMAPTGVRAGRFLRRAGLAQS